MSLNRSLLSQVTRNLTKKPSRPRLPRNQWQAPGEVTRIPSDSITMQGVGFPVVGIADTGQQTYMLPGEDYHYPGASYVDEYPLLQPGGVAPSDRAVNRPYNPLQIQRNRQEYLQRQAADRQAVLRPAGSRLAPAAKAALEDQYERQQANRRINSRQDKVSALGAVLAPVPVVGELYNTGSAIANGLVDAAQGEYGDVALSLLPYVGSKGVSAYRRANAFKSEIDWSRWNPDTPKYPQLIKEYNAIEKQAKKDGSWMKNPDGSPYEGLPEQFIQQRSKAFQKAYPQGADITYRGDPSHFPELRARDHEFYNRAIFTADENLAKNYGHILGRKGYYSPTIPFSDEPGAWRDKRGGVHQLLLPKTKDEIYFDAGGREWNFLKNRELFEEIYPDGKNDINDTFFSTDDLASYIEDVGIQRARIDNINDGGPGNIIIHNQKPGNYAKSFRGNVGFFDLTDPNIYKGVALPVIGAAAAAPEYARGGQHGGLDRWFAEKWVDIKTGKPCGRQQGESRKGYPACRPSRRISDDTPKTAGELSAAERQRFKREKTSSDRIDYQHRRRATGGQESSYDQLLTTMTNQGRQTGWLDSYN